MREGQAIWCKNDYKAIGELTMMQEYKAEVVDNLYELVVVTNDMGKRVAYAQSRFIASLFMGGE